MLHKRPVADAFYQKLQHSVIAEGKRIRLEQKVTRKAGSLLNRILPNEGVLQYLQYGGAVPSVGRVEKRIVGAAAEAQVFGVYVACQSGLPSPSCAVVQRSVLVGVVRQGCTTTLGLRWRSAS